MKNIDKRTIIIVAITLAIGLLAGWLIFGVEKTNSHDDHQHIETEVDGKTIWTCSMHPQIRKSEAGDCPICGMELIPVEDDENEELDELSISMSETAMKLANVSTAIVEQSNAAKELRLSGKVQADERLIHSQSSHISGRIEKLLVNFTGDYVSKGQIIAKIYSPELVNAQEELFEAKKHIETQEVLFNAAKEKLKNWKLSEDQIDKIISSGKIQEEFPIEADVSGYITKKLVNQGDYISKGDAIFEISELSKVWILFDVYESDLNWIEKGDKVEFTVSSLAGESFEARISYIDPIINSKTRVAKARIEYNNSNGKLKPEMFVSGVVKSKLSNKSNFISVPKTAVMWTGKRSVVYVKSKTMQGVYFKMREITLGPDLGDSYLIESGLEVGEEIAVNGTFSIDAAAQLAGKPSMMSPEGGNPNSGHNHGDMTIESNNSSQEKSNQTSSEQIKLSSKAKAALIPLYESYLQWKDKLIDDNFTAAQKKAVDFKEELENIEMQLFEGKSQNLWMKYQSDLSRNLEHIHHFSDIENLRKSFQTVSASLIEMSKSFKAFDEIIYVQHCPMADNNNGADWLSTNKDIKNPYFGNSMLKCGEIIEEIK
jgi:Cu(I)/Ag(I) efflux system membrane fusion protein